MKSTDRLKRAFLAISLLCADPCRPPMLRKLSIHRLFSVSRSTAPVALACPCNGRRLPRQRTKTPDGQRTHLTSRSKERAVNAREQGIRGT
eukprot:scaffold345_cov371-Pavlova_lutheri.AAC.7